MCVCQQERVGQMFEEKLIPIPPVSTLWGEQGCIHGCSTSVGGVVQTGHRISLWISLRGSLEQ